MTPHLPPSAQPKPGESKLKSVDRLLTALKTDLATPGLTAPQLTATLEQLKIYGRDPNGSDPIFTNEGIRTLCSYAFDAHTADISTSREALRCIANALLLKEEARQLFVDLGYDMKAAEKLKDTVPDDEFLLSRILFLVTYSTTANLPHLLSTGLSSHINTILTRHTTSPITGIHESALVETLKLLFNLSHHTSDSTLSSCLPTILTLLHTSPLPTPPLQGVIPHLINAPLSFDLTSHIHTLFPTNTPSKTTDRLITILDASTSSSTFDDTGIPLITLLRKLLTLAPAPTLASMKSALLPQDSDRNAPLGTTDSLPSRLLRFTASASAPELREHVSSLLFELSDSRPETYVRNVGYGYASGLLISRGLQAGAETLAPEIGDVNPVTGQKVESESVVDPFEGMAEEEKEREAERLFVLFERLKKTGVVDVKNPVQQAVEEGRFEEID